MPSEPLDRRYRPTKAPRLRTRAQMVVLSAEPALTVAKIAAIVRESEATVRRWRKRDRAEGVNGLHDVPRPGRPAEVTDTYRAELVAAVRRRPRSLDLPFFWWTLQRLADDLAECPGLRVSDETVRRALKQAGIGRSRPQPKISRPDPDSQVKTRRWKRPATPCPPERSLTTPTHAMSAGGPPGAPCGARGGNTS
jgi:transposase